MFAPSHLLHYSPSRLGTDFSLNITKVLIPWMEEEFGTSYPLPKLDAVSLPHFYYSAMENYGLLTFKYARSLDQLVDDCENYMLLTGIQYCSP